MTMFDEARAILEMLRICNETQRNLAERIGVSQSYIANKLRLLSFTKGEEAEILAAGLSERHARALLRLSGEERRQALRHTVKKNLTVRQCEDLVNKMYLNS